MGTRNTKAQQRGYNAAYAERMAASGKRRLSLYLPALLARAVEQEARRLGISRSQAAEAALGDWLMRQPVKKTGDISQAPQDKTAT